MRVWIRCTILLKPLVKTLGWRVRDHTTHTTLAVRHGVRSNGKRIGAIRARASTFGGGTRQPRTAPKHRRAARSGPGRVMAQHGAGEQGVGDKEHQKTLPFPFHEYPILPGQRGHVYVTGIFPSFTLFGVSLWSRVASCLTPPRRRRARESIVLRK